MRKTKGIILAAIVLVLVAAGALGLFLMQDKNKSVVELGNKADVSWYDEKGEEFTITTAEELYGLVKLSDYYDFKDQTFKLGADIIVNEGNAEDWGKEAPTHRWYPIDGFAGTFDGQGHTISGIYSYGYDIATGLFANTQASSVIKNFKLVNSYFRVDGSFPIGSIASNGCGNFENIYSDAIVITNGEDCGGFIGRVNDDGKVSTTAKTTRITNCWFDGEVKLLTSMGRYGGGFAGHVVGGTLNMSHCLNTAPISCETTVSNGLYVGGLVGALNYANFSGTLYLTDCLNAGKIDVPKTTATGSVIGGTIAKTSMVVTDTYTTEQAHTEVCSYQKGSADGGFPMMNTEFIVGPEWYSWTTLDYENYWTVTEDSTPILRYFADKTVDTSGLAKAYSFDWYQEGVLELELSTVEDLYGFALMSYSKNFEGMIVSLANDIAVNAGGKASDWAAGKSVPENYWIPIGRSVRFEGIFDGKGHTISGLYAKTEVAFTGLFGWIGTYGEAKNFRLTNSYFESTATGSCAIGSVTGRLEGKINTVYSDAYVTTAGSLNGGIAGYKLTADTVSTITNCWYAGTIKMLGDLSKHTGGIAGRCINGTLELSNCLFTGKISIDGQTRSANTGGFVGNINGNLVIKSSLNAGIFEVTEAEKMNSTCRVLGQMSNVETASLTLENTYFTNDGDNGTWYWYYSGTEDRTTGGAELKEVEDILGYDGYRATNLDFKNYWTVVVNKDGTPILKSFASKTPSVAGLEKTFDTSWYDENKTTYVLKDRKDLYGLIALSNSNINFKGKTIKLANDIVVNTTGTAEEWAAGTATPTYEWTPIGKNVRFEGTFDGQGHTISGVCGTSDTSFMGLFAWVGTEGTVKNLRLTNSYFASTVEDSAAIGSIAGRLEGNIDTVYSDAIIKSVSALNGGIAGYKLTKDTKSNIKNCWYDGTIYMVGDNSKHTGGIIGRVISGTVEINNCLFSGKISIGGATRSANTGGFAGNINGNLIIKSSLNSGVFEVTEAAKMNSTCRVLGQVSNVDGVSLTLDKVYFTNKGDNGTWTWYYSGDKDVVTGAAELKEEADIMGYDGYATTDLDFDKYWTVVVDADGTPILKSFATKVPSLAGVEKTFDISWYDESKTTYVLKDRADLYGFVNLTNSDIDFKGKTVTLGNDIVVNKTGTAAEWAAGTATPEYVWAPISKQFAFEGTFDGKGYTISGLCGTADTAFMGLFGWTGTNSEIKNLRLTNSYFASTETSSAAIGSIAGRLEGDITNVYSDAIISSPGALNGGIAGYRNSDATGTISNCWYNGTINMLGDSSKMTGGIIGRIIKGELVIDNCLFSGTIKVGGKTRSSSTGGFVGGVIDNLVLKNSLNTGVFEITESDKINSLGRVIGQIENSANTDVTVENVYFTNKGVSATYKWYKPGSVSVLTGDATQVEEGNIVGEYGYYNLKFDFNNYWALVMKDTNGEDGTPILKSFATAIPELPTPPSYADMSWYDESKDSYVISDSADLYGLSFLSKTGVTFAGKTIKIDDSVTEIKMNTTGTVAEWAAGTVTPDYNWEPIGKRVPFEGTFDGNGKTISGIYGVTETPYMGLFGQTAAGSTVKNLRLTDSYFATSTSKYGTVGSIAGLLGGNLENVYSNAVVSTTNQISGGLVGAIWSNGDVSMKNCWFDGSVSSTNHYTAGMVAWIQNGAVTMENCLNSGSVHYEHTGFANAAGFCASMIMWDYQTDKEASNYTLSLTIKNSLNVGQVTNGTQARAGSILGNKSGNTTMAVENVYATNESYKLNDVAMAVGRGAYTGIINMVDASSITGNMAYFNTSLDFVNAWALVTDGTPILKIFATTIPELPKAPEGADISWFNGAEATYTLSDKEDLYGFAYLSSMGVTFEGKTISLAADITVNEGTITEWDANGYAGLENWTPIASFEKPFAGTFDGKGHSIIGLYGKTTTEGMGLFMATAEGSTIKNLKLTNSYFTTSTSKYGTVGSIVGHCAGNLENVYSDAFINAKNQINGGLIGRISSTQAVSIKNCWFAGTVRSTSHYTGGIVGWIQNGAVTMENCLNSGKVNYSHTGFANAGGFCAYMVMWDWKTDSEVSNYTVSLTIKNSLNYGQVNNGTQARAGSILGNKSGNTTMTVENVYATNESYQLNGSAMAVGRGSYTGTINMVALSDITVSGSVTATNVHTTLSGLDFNNIWVVGERNTPVLQWATATGFDTSWYDEAATSYTISTAEELYGVAYLNSVGVDFAGKTIDLEADITVNEGTVAEWKTNNYANLKTWTPIVGFAGTLNGNNHSIQGIYVNSTELGAAFIKNTVAGSTIKNLKFENSYINSTKDIAGSVVASLGGNMENVYSSATVNSTGNYAGGLMGQIFSTGNVSVKNCWFAGTMNAKSNAAGIVGLVSNGTIVIENCLNTGSVTTTNDSVGGFFGRTFTSGQEWALSGSGTVNLTIKQCLNAGAIKGRNNVGSAIGWKQKGTVNVESFYATETSTGASTSGVLIGAGTLNSGSVTAVKLADITVAGSVKEADVISKLSALDFSIIWGIGANNTPELSWVNNLNTDTRWYDESKTSYTISTLKELNGLVALSTSGETFAGKTINLGADIVVNEGTVSEWDANGYANLKTWTPIGTLDQPFAGTFNGNGHTISGVYATTSEQGMGLFMATAEGSTIKNLKLTNSYIKSTYSGTYATIGSVVGRCGGNLESVYSNAIVKVNKNASGGIAGQVWSTGSVSIKKCWFDGSVISSAGHSGGIAGYLSCGTITMENCLNTGKVNYAGAFVGGLCGNLLPTTKAYAEDQNATLVLNMKNCLNIGQVKNSDSARVGSVIGNKNGRKTMTVENVYATNESYMNNGAGKAVGNGTLNSGSVTMVSLSDITVAGSVTAENVKAKLGGFDFDTIWTIGTKGTPELRLGSSSQAASLFTRTAMVIVNSITN